MSPAGQMPLETNVEQITVNNNSILLIPRVNSAEDAISSTLYPEHACVCFLVQRVFTLIPDINCPSSPPLGYASARSETLVISGAKPPQGLLRLLLL